MIQDGQLVKFVNGGDAARIQKVQIAVGRDATRAPRVQHSERGMPVQVVTGEDPTRAPFIHPFEGLAPAAWFRQGVGITVTGSGVSQWDDLSGNGRHLLQGTDSARPALQADGSVLFNGTSHYLKCNAFTLDQPTCVLMVVKQVSWSVSDVLCDGNASNTNGLYQRTSTPRIQQYAGSAFGTENAGLALGSVGVIASVANGAASWLRVNNGATIVSSIGTANAGGFTVGARADGLAPSNIQVYETVIFPIAPSTAQLDRLVAGLMARHGVA